MFAQGIVAPALPRWPPPCPPQTWARVRIAALRSFPPAAGFRAEIRHMVPSFARTARGMRAAARQERASATSLASCARLRAAGVRYLDPFVNLADPDKLAERLVEVFDWAGVSLAEAREAVRLGYAEDARVKADIAAEGERALT